MSDEQRLSGFYVVGRDDGSIEPVLVRLKTLPRGEAELYGHPMAVRAAVRANSKPGHWWRPVIVPDHLPQDFAGPGANRCEGLIP